MLSSVLVRLRLAAMRMFERGEGAGSDGGSGTGTVSYFLCRRLVTIATLVLLSLGWTVPVLVAQTDEVPVDLQAALFEKIFRYVKTMERPDRIVVLAVFAEDGRRKAKRVADAFAELGVDSRPVEMQELRESIEAGTVLYVLPSAPRAEVAALCQEYRLLSLSGLATDVESGGAAVGVGLDDGRPQILVNMKRLERDGHRISADLLKLAKVIR